MGTAEQRPTRMPIRRGCCGLPPLRHVKHAPPYQVIPFVQQGYRVNYNLKQCALSLFTLHNESLNIWTHLIGAGYVCYVLTGFLTGLRNLFPMHWTEYLAIMTFLLCALACLSLSTLYHWLGSSGPRAYEILLRADLVGIALLIGGSYVPGIFYAFHCFPAYQGFYQVVTVLSLILGLIGAIFTDLHCPKQSNFRTYTFAFLVGFGLVPAIHWACIAPAKTRMIFLDNLAGMFFWYFLGFLFFTTRFPEVMFPWRFDLILSSHQLWHICIVFAVVTWLHGILEYHHILHEAGCHVFDTA